MPTGSPHLLTEGRRVLVERAALRTNHGLAGLIGVRNDGRAQFRQVARR